MYSRAFYKGGVALIIASLLFIGGYALGSGEKLSAAALSPLFSGESAEAPVDVDLDQFWKVWSVLEDRFVDEGAGPESQDKVWGAIKGLTRSYDDPYTVFLTPEEASIFQENISGTFSGVGMEIAIEDGVLTVVAPLKDSPAEKTGIKPGDKILEIGGESTEEMSVDEAVLLIRGKAGTQVSVVIWHPGEKAPAPLTLTRKNISIPTLETKILPGNIFYLRLYSFSANSAELVNKAIEEYRSSKSQALILDLRNNPGGYLEAAVDISSHFLEEGKVIVTEDYGEGNEDKVHRSAGRNTFPENHKIIILVNEGSASASEIVAGALSEHKRATLVGRETFGKGSVQELVPITKDTALKVTIARWLTPQNHSLSKEGIKPDVLIEETDNEADDPDLEKALELINQ